MAIPIPNFARFSTAAFSGRNPVPDTTTGRGAQAENGLENGALIGHFGSRFIVAGDPDQVGVNAPLPQSRAPRAGALPPSPDQMRSSDWFQIVGKVLGHFGSRFIVVGERPDIIGVNAKSG